MENLQLELNLENKSPLEMQMAMMQKQLDLSCESLGKVRRKLFAEMTSIKNLCAVLQKENADLKARLMLMNHEKTEWVYGQNGCLFDVREVKIA